MSSLSAANKDKIAKNRKAVFELEGVVNHNKARAYLTRSAISENAQLIHKNYSAAFLGNRQIANENTEAIFRNRHALINTLPSTNEVEINFREAWRNKAKLEYLQHRSQLNSTLLAISQDLSALNKAAIGVNRKVMDANERIKDFNAGLIADNTALIGAVHNPTPESNAAIIAQNAVVIEEIRKRVGENDGVITALWGFVDSNRNDAIENAKLIANRREEILNNHKLIVENAKRIADLI